MTKKWLQYLIVLLCGAVIILAYVWFISTGLWTTWPSTSNYYDQLAKSFKEGHLYLDVQLNPALLSFSDPYDPDARQATPGLGINDLKAIWDMELYGGKIYLYWGPAPALILAVIKLLYRMEIGDQHLTFIFISGLFFFQSMILLRAWRRFFPQLPIWAILSGIFVAGFINPIPWILNIPRIYEAAIASDQFFFIGGLYFIFAGLDRPSYSIWRLALAGTFFVFAIGSRATIAIPISFIVLMVLLEIIKWGKINKVIPNLIYPVAGFCLPLLGGITLLGWYNQARFGSIFEFGFRYGITMVNQNKYHDVLFSPIYIIPNLYLYFFNPPSINHLFPFIRPVWNGEFISNFHNLFPTIYNAERITGLLYVYPFSIFALIPILNIVKPLLGRSIRIQAERDQRISANNNDFFRWMVIVLAGCLVLEFLTIFLIFYGTMRYFMDATPTLALLSILGFWQGYSLLMNKTAWNKLFVVIGITLIIISIGISILLAFSSDVARIRSNNPSLLTHLRLFFTHILNNH